MSGMVGCARKMLVGPMMINYCLQVGKEFSELRKSEIICPLFIILSHLSFM